MKITDMIDQGDLSEKPGWVRISLHPTMTDGEVRDIGTSVVEVVRNARQWEKEYIFDSESGEYHRKEDSMTVPAILEEFAP